MRDILFFNILKHAYIYFLHISSRNIEKLNILRPEI